MRQCGPSAEGAKEDERDPHSAGSKAGAEWEEYARRRQTEVRGRHLGGDRVDPQQGKYRYKTG